MVEMVPKIVSSERCPQPAADLKSLHHVTACSDVAIFKKYYFDNLLPPSRSPL
jgi:hypothetical protein